MSKPKVLITRPDIPENGIKKIKEHCDVDPEKKPIPKEELIKLISGKNGLVSVLTDPIDKEVIDAAECGMDSETHHFDRTDINLSGAKKSDGEVSSFIGNHEEDDCKTLNCEKELRSINQENFGEATIRALNARSTFITQSIREGSLGTAVG
ncbi:hypothetical protein AVEN_170206-1 [Araneus ventricosus]|uniref:D-glycerate dehydrogenase n=1 Tax=Araneus ventricosus TaxID=182803 RepID=A0A4Y2P2L7_ARAVE|nr:hypothetical protein AVEN_170206-1 [Araneus ventricosus]